MFIIKGHEIKKPIKLYPSSVLNDIAHKPDDDSNGSIEVPKEESTMVELMYPVE